MTSAQSSRAEDRAGGAGRERPLHRARATASGTRSSVFIGALWMVGISLVLFFLPLINGLIGGLVGGYKVGAIGKALLAAVIPAIVVAFGLWLILAVFDPPMIVLVGGLAGGFLVLLADVGLFIGAAIGGAIAQKR